MASNVLTTIELREIRYLDDQVTEPELLCELGKPLDAALLLRKGLTPYEISISPEWTGGKNLNPILGYLDRAIGEKIPYGDPLTKAEILYSIPRTRRELVQKAISIRQYPNRLYEHDASHWRSVEEARTDFEILRKYGDSTDAEKPANRFGYLFEDIWATESRLAAIIERVMREKSAEDW